MQTTETPQFPSASEADHASRQPVIVGLDIGTTKIVAIAGRKNEFGKLEILGFGRANSNGVRGGMVQNISQTIESIQLAIQHCLASNPGLDIRQVYVGIAGQHIKTLQTRGNIVRQHIEDEIRQEEVDQLVKDQRKTFIPASDEIIDVIPQTYTVDNIPDIYDPVGYTGVKIGADFLLITGDSQAIRNINRSVERAGLGVRDLILQPLASSAAVMCEQDLEAGVAILDIGGGTTDLAVFHEGILKLTAVIPFGGEIITQDIKNGLGVMRSQAEQMKIKFGSALAEHAQGNTFITIPGIRGLPNRNISVKNLAEVIQARMSEIFEYVNYHLKQTGLDAGKLNGGIVLTGGGSQLKHLKQLTEFETGLNARIGLPNEHLAANHLEELAKPMYATCIGLILKGYHIHDHTLGEGADTLTIHHTTATPISNPGLASPSEPSEAPLQRTRKPRMSMKDFMDSIKHGIVEIFKEEEEYRFPDGTGQGAAKPAPPAEDRSK
ncbi:MAG: cell division protein FtsA [Bacteroidetes bacterium]|nr:cell division protein FtsA [Bacteroidota bacterium]